MRAEPTEPSWGGRFPKGWARLLVFAVTTVAFLPALMADFVLIDDDQNILANPSFRGFGLDRLAWMFSTSHMGHYQPLTWLSYAADHAIAGLHPLAYHLTSLVLHAGTAFVVYGLARHLLSLGKGRSGHAVEIGAFASALLFAVHPLRVESVAWATGRNDLTSGLLAALAATTWLRWVARRGSDPSGKTGEQVIVLLLGVGSVVLLLGSLDFGESNRLTLASAEGVLGGTVLFLLATILVVRATGAPGLFLATIALFGLSLAGKASAVMLPLVLLVLDLWPLARLFQGPVRTKVLRVLSLIAEKTPLLVLAIVFGRIAFWAKHGHSMSTLIEHSPGERLLQVGYGIAFYPWKTLVPVGLVPIYDLPAHISLRDLAFPLAWAGVLVVSLGMWVLRRRLPGFGVAWWSYVILVSPVLGLFQSGPQLVADRYSYLACLPFAVLLGALATHLMETKAARWVAGGVIVILGSVAATWQQTSRWRSSEALFSYAASINGSPRVLTNWALERSRWAELDPKNRQAYLESALALSDRALATAVERDVYVPTYRLHHGTILYNLGRYAEAIDELSRYNQEAPGDPQGLLNEGLALNAAGRHVDAADVLLRALVVQPDCGACWRNLGFALEGSGRPEEAIDAYRRSLLYEPSATAEARLRRLEAGA